MFLYFVEQCTYIYETIPEQNNYKKVDTKTNAWQNVSIKQYNIFYVKALRFIGLSEEPL